MTSPVGMKDAGWSKQVVSVDWQKSRPSSEAVWLEAKPLRSSGAPPACSGGTSTGASLGGQSRSLQRRLPRPVAFHQLTGRQTYGPAGGESDYERLHSSLAPVDSPRPWRENGRRFRREPLPGRAGCARRYSCHDHPCCGHASRRQLEPPWIPSSLCLVLEEPAPPAPPASKTRPWSLRQGTGSPGSQRAHGPFGDLYNLESVDRTDTAGRFDSPVSTAFGPRRWKPVGVLEEQRERGAAEASQRVDLRDGGFHVGGIEGSIDRSVRRGLFGLRRRQRDETPRWQYPVVRLDPSPGKDKALGIRAAARWVGPIPSGRPGSVCRIVALGGRRLRLSRAAPVATRPSGRGTARWRTRARRKATARHCAAESRDPMPPVAGTGLATLRSGAHRASNGHARRGGVGSQVARSDPLLRRKPVRAEVFDSSGTVLGRSDGHVYSSPRPGQITTIQDIRIRIVVPPSAEVEEARVVCQLRLASA
jgi:hypothetical protein